MAGLNPSIFLERLREAWSLSSNVEQLARQALECASTLPAPGRRWLERAVLETAARDSDALRRKRQFRESARRLGGTLGALEQELRSASAECVVSLQRLRALRRALEDGRSGAKTGPLR